MISIIIPVYNAERTIQTCVDSILALSFDDYELILVDDGSKDTSPVICDLCAENDSRIIVIHTHNAGAAAARNRGLDIARGEYILFCDADDCYNSHELDKFLSTALASTDPLSLFSFNYFNMWPSGVEPATHYPQNNVLLSSDSNKVDFLSSRTAHDVLGYSLWNKLYSRQVMDQYQIRMFERDQIGNRNDWAEDLMFNLQYYTALHSIYATGNDVYLIRKHVPIESEQESTLVGYVNHMLTLFAELSTTPVFNCHDLFREQFWQIVIWHMRRYLYAELGSCGIVQLRKQCMADRHNGLLLACISSALHNWSSFGCRWNDYDSRDYRNILEYIKDGNRILFKLKSYWLWKIYPKIPRLLGDKQ